MNNNVGDMPIDIYCDYIQDIIGEEWTWWMLVPAINDTLGPRLDLGSGVFWHMRFVYDDMSNPFEVAIGNATIIPEQSSPLGDGYFTTHQYEIGYGAGDHAREGLTE